MKTRVWLVAALAVALGLCAASVSQGAGQNGRLGALGVDGDVVEDPVNVGVYPSNMLFWTNLVTADIGTGDIAHHSLWGSWEVKGLGILGLGLTGEQIDRNALPDQTPRGDLFSLYYGWTFGKKGGIGTVLDYASDWKERTGEQASQNGITGVENEKGGSTIGTRVGIHKPVGLFRRVDASIGYSRHTWEDAQRSVLNRDRYDRLREGESHDNSLDLNLRALSGDGPITFIPSLHAALRDGEAEMSDLRGADLDSGRGTESTQDSRSFSGQMGLQVKARKRTTIYATLGIQYRSSEIEQGNFEIDEGGIDAVSYSGNNVEKTIIDLPYAAIGVEAGLRRWLTLRFGATKRQRTDRTEWVTYQGRDAPRQRSLSTTEETTSPMEIHYGLGIEAGNFALDVVLNNDFLYDWGYIVSGERQTPMTEVSVTYAFD